MAIERCLIVDENEANILFFQVLLKDLGYGDQVFTATSGLQALELVEEEKIQFIITAWEMAVMPGTIFIQKVKATRRRRYMPFLIFSKRMSDADIRLTQDLGIGNVLSMPFDKTVAKQLLKDTIDKENSIPASEQRVRKMEAYLQEGRPNEALKLLDVTLNKKGPGYKRAQTVLAEMWMQIIRYDKCETCLKEALEEDGKYSPALHLLAKLYMKTQRHDEAIDLLEKMAQDSAKNIQTLINLGSAYVDTDQHEKAKATLGQAMILDEDCQGAKDQLGKLAFKEGDVSLAAQFLAQTENGDELARSFNNMAVALVTKGNYPKAIETYNGAMKVLSSKAKLHLLQFNLGLAYRKQGDVNNGFRALAHSYMADPQFEKAYASLAKLAKEMQEKGMELDKELLAAVKKTRQANPPRPAPARKNTVNNAVTKKTA
jgi:tetratricopeptide (TPR) repeat protein